MNKFKYLLIIFILSFLFIINVKAETGVVTDGSGVNMRDNPSIDSNVLVAIPVNKEFYISNLNAGTGNGCGTETDEDPWYYVYYNNSYGYICSTYVEVKPESENNELSTSYNRPWTTPKKAIVGGANFISSSYIAKGQYTSYLKKFNVKKVKINSTRFDDGIIRVTADVDFDYTASYKILDNEKESSGNNSDIMYFDFDYSKDFKLVNISSMAKLFI